MSFAILSILECSLTENGQQSTGNYILYVLGAFVCYFEIFQSMLVSRFAYLSVC